MALKNGRTTTVVQAILVGSVIPSGTVSPFVGGAIPSGWLLCDGTAVSRTTYASLYASILDSHGYGDTSTTFNLPDLRGRFLRGVDGTAGNDPDTASRTAMNTGGNTANAIGSVQGDINKLHGHPWRQSAIGTANGGATGGFKYYTASGTGAAYTGTPSDAVGQTIGGDGGNETRPKNANVNYIIKV